MQEQFSPLSESNINDTHSHRFLFLATNLTNLSPLLGMKYNVMETIYYWALFSAQDIKYILYKPVWGFVKSLLFHNALSSLHYDSILIFISISSRGQVRKPITI